MGLAHRVSTDWALCFDRLHSAHQIHRDHRLAARDERMKGGRKPSLKTYVLEFAVYGVLVVGYYFLVLHFLGDWLFELFSRERTTYAFVALGLIGAQGILLDLVTTLLLRLITSSRGQG